MDCVKAAGLFHKCVPDIASEVRQVLAGELHYQAMIYHVLRSKGGLPASQLGLNVKQWIANPRTELFRGLDLRKAERYRGGFEPIPDLVIFHPDVAGNWQRRDPRHKMKYMRLAIEVKASERAGGRLRPGEVIRDILKLAAHRDEVHFRRGKFTPVMLIVDVAPGKGEQMTHGARAEAVEAAREHAVDWVRIDPGEIEALRFSSST